MAAPNLRRTLSTPSVLSVRTALTGCFFAVLLLSPLGISAQRAELVYISNVTGTNVGGRALTTVEDQAAAALDKLGEELRARGLDYSDVVVSNVFLRDTRFFQGMNGVYRTYFQTDPPTRATVQADLMDPDALIQISVVAARGPKEVITPAGLKSPELPYSWGFKVANTLFLSGATSRSPETYQPVPGDVSTQTRRVFGNIGMVLEEAGMSYADLVTCRVFLDDPRGYDAMNRAYAQAVPPEDPPARATVRSGLMNPLFSTEIQCVAEASSRREVVRAEGQARRELPFSPGIDTGDRLYLAGVVGQGGDIAEETRAALDGIRGTLEAASKKFSDVENVWVYLADIRDWEVVQAIMIDTMGDDMPAPTVVGTRLMGRSGVEIQMVAGG
jgi:2-iminobutanoate/2-iminopropanoate deaminase